MSARIELEWAKQIGFDPHAVREIVEDVLVENGMSVWYGEPGSGKTTLLLDALLRMPHARSWLGKRLDRRASILISPESPHSVRLRLEAYRRHHGLDNDIGPFALIPTAVNFLDLLEVDELAEKIIEEVNKLGFANLGLIGVDTVARVMPGGDENTAQDMGRLVTAGDLLRTRTGAHIAFVHHSGKDSAKGARGHSSLRAATDTEIEVVHDKSNSLRSLEIMKQRDLGTVGMKLTARFKQVELARNQWDRPVTACVVEHEEPPSLHLRSVMQQVDDEHAESVVLAGLKAVRKMGIAATDARNANGFLPRQLLEKGLAGGIDKDGLVAAVNRLMKRGILRRGLVGKDSSRHSIQGLVLASEADADFAGSTA